MAAVLDFGGGRRRGIGVLRGPSLPAADYKPRASLEDSGSDGIRMSSGSGTVGGTLEYEKHTTALIMEHIPRTLQLYQLEYSYAYNAFLFFPRTVYRPPTHTT